MSKNLRIWYAWIYMPNGYKGIIKINSYDDLSRTCDVIFSGGITAKAPMNWIHACNGCILPWEEDKKCQD